MGKHSHFHQIMQKSFVLSYMIHNNQEHLQKYVDSLQILSHLPPETRALVNSGQVIIQITSLSAGSVIVNFSIFFQPSSNLTMSSMSSDFIASLQNSTTYTVDTIYIEGTGYYY